MDVNYYFQRYCDFLSIADSNKMLHYSKTLHKISDISREKNDNLMLTMLKDALHIEPKIRVVESAHVVVTLRKLRISCVELDDYQSAKVVHEQEFWIKIK